MLPDIGTAERDALEAEALDVGMRALHESNGNIPEALYKVYQHFRERFISENGFMDSPPGGQRWVDMLVDARQLEHYVGDIWATSIAENHTSPA